MGRISVAFLPHINQKSFVQPQIHITSEIEEKCATVLLRRDVTALFPPPPRDYLT